MDDINKEIVNNIDNYSIDELINMRYGKEVKLSDEAKALLDQKIDDFQESIQKTPMIEDSNNDMNVDSTEDISNIKKVLDAIDKSGIMRYSAYLPGLCDDVFKLKTKYYQQQFNGITTPSLTPENDTTVPSSLIDDEFKIDDADIRKIARKKYIQEERFTSIKKKLSSVKKAMVSVPQKICDVTRSLLGKIRNKVSYVAQNVENKSIDASKKVEDKFVNYSDNNQGEIDKVSQAMDELFEKSSNLDKMNPFERYETQKLQSKLLKKEYRRYKKLNRQGNFVAKLRPGIVRMTLMPANLIKKIRDRENNNNSYDYGEEQLSSVIRV